MKISEIRPPEEILDGIFQRLTQDFKTYLRKRLDALPDEYKKSSDMRQRVTAIAHYDFDCLVAHSLRGLNGGLMPDWKNYEKLFEAGEYAKEEYQV